YADDAVGKERFLELQAPSEVSAQKPQSGTERRVQRLFAQVLGRSPETLPSDQPFMSLGGSSLKAVRLLDLMEQEFATSLTHEILLKCSTIQASAAYIDDHLARMQNQA